MYPEWLKIGARWIRRDCIQAVRQDRDSGSVCVDYTDGSSEAFFGEEAAALVRYMENHLENGQAVDLMKLCAAGV